ncbi:MAG: hypothetical protein MK213_05450 [Planctomycetes bacterium]|nr:hypothetical protein [Planctomycetota bacterium]
MRGTLTVILVCAAISFVGIYAPAVMTGLFDGLDAALGWAGPFTVVTLVSALTGLLFIMALPHVSPQVGIVAVKDKIKHHLLSIRIFQDDLPTVGRGVAGALSWNLVYLVLNLLPMIVLAVPFMLVWFQLNSLYAFTGFQEGERTIVVAEVAKDVSPAEIKLSLPEGNRLVNRVNMTDKFAFTVEAGGQGSSALRFEHAGSTETKPWVVQEDPHRLARIRTADPWADFTGARDPMMVFGDPRLSSASFLTAVWVEFPTAPLGPFEGGEITIMLIFILVSIGVAFGLKNKFGVEI